MDWARWFRLDWIICLGVAVQVLAIHKIAVVRVWLIPLCRVSVACLEDPLPVNRIHIPNNITINTQTPTRKHHL